jgi:hypothetical protein
MAILRQYLEQLRAKRPEQDTLPLHRLGVPISAMASQRRAWPPSQAANRGPATVSTLSNGALERRTHAPPPWAVARACPA